MHEKLATLKAKIQENSNVVIVSVLVASAAIAIGIYAVRTKTPPVPEYLAVVNTYPYSPVTDLGSRISVLFNMAVTAHHADAYFKIDPSIGGQLVQGGSANEIMFVPSSPLIPGTQLKITLLAGLPSDNGKQLTQEYNFSINILANEADGMRLTRNAFDEKFMSFDTNRGTDIDVAIGPDIKKAEVKIFKASISDLLGSLVYTPYQENYDYAYEYGTYEEKPVDTAKLKLVKTETAFPDKKLNFKSEPGIYLFEARDGERIITT